jgi:phage tail-like protein
MADPYRSYKYEVEIDGFTRAGFAKVSGLKATVEAIEYREGGENETPHQLPGQSKFDDITLERGYSDDIDFQTWMDAIYNIDNSDGAQGDDEFRKDITIFLKDKSGKRVVKWTIKRTWPKERSTSDLDANANEVLVESLVLANEGIKETRL